MYVRAGCCVAWFGIALFAACVGDDPAAGTRADAGVASSSSGSADGSPGTQDGASGGVTVPGVVIDDRYAAGDRLEPTWLGLPDGTQQFAGWYDKTLKTRCTYRAQNNGRYACVPDAEEASNSSGIYADSTCTLPQAGVVEASCSRVPSFVKLTVGATCFDDVYASGALLANPYVLFSACEPAVDRGKAFVLGDKVASPDLVQGDLEEWADTPSSSGPRPIRAQFMRGSDGSLGFHHWALETANAECTFSKQPFDETVRCYPKAPATASSITYTDPACTSLLAEARSAESECTGKAAQIAVLTHPATDACSYLPTGMDWFTLSPAVSTTFYRKNEAGDCAPYDTNIIQAHAVTASLPVAAFGAPVVEAPAGTDFQSLHVQLADGTRGRHGFYDGVRKVRCTMERAADLSYRCIPDESSSARYVFTDAACTVQKIVSRVVTAERVRREQCVEQQNCSDAGLSCGTPAKPTYVRLPVYTPCSFDRTVRAFTTGAPLTEYFARDPDGVCVGIPVTEGEAVYDLTEIPPAQLFGAVPSHP